jgi:hypothetical protein
MTVKIFLYLSKFYFTVENIREIFVCVPCGACYQELNTLVCPLSREAITKWFARLKVGRDSLLTQSTVFSFSVILRLTEMKIFDVHFKNGR